MNESLKSHVTTQLQMSIMHSNSKLIFNFYLGFCNDYVGAQQEIFQCRGGFVEFGYSD